MTNKKTYTLKRDNNNLRLFTYDPYYIQIGNSDLRVKLGDPKGETYSNIGNKFAFFDCVSQNQLFGTGTDSKYTEAVSYEVYQLIFK